MEREAISKLVQVTHLNQNQARRLLAANNWNINAALEAHYSGGGGGGGGRGGGRQQQQAARRGDEGKLRALFDKWAGEGEDKDAMFGEHMAEFFQQVKVDPEGVGSLAVAWKLGCAGQGEITRAEFVKGFSEQGADTLAAIQEICAGWIAQLEQERPFRTFYRWLFDYAKADPQRKVVDTSDALDLWALVLPLQWPEAAEHWVEFVEQEKPAVISKDVWNQVLEFGLDVGDRWDEYDFEGSAWPGLMDRFAEHMQKQSAEQQDE